MGRTDIAKASRHLAGALAAFTLATCSNVSPDDSEVSRRSAITSEELACQLSDQANPFHYQAVWEAIPNTPTYAALFWDNIIPDSTSSCGQRVRTMFWEMAVPNNWAWLNTKLYPDWPWNSGGYFT